jgi:autotransporter-associated beta strand protein
VVFGISGTGTLKLGVKDDSDIADHYDNTLNAPVADDTTIDVLSGSNPGGGDRFWDGNITSGITDGVSQGGNGTWDTTTTNWDPGFGFANPIAWNNANLDTAILGGANGTITLGDAITAGGITSSATYTINSNTLTFDVASGTPVIDTASGALTINSQISGDKGLEKTGAGIIRFSTSNTTHDYSGGFTLSQGELDVQSQGSNSSFLGTGTFTINGGTLIRMSRTTGVAWTSDNDNIWTGGTILFTRPSGDNPKWQNDGNITLQGNVTLNRSGAIAYGVIMNGDISEDGGSFSLTFNGLNNADSEFTLAGNNTYSGGTNIGQRSLFLNSSGALGTGPLAMNGTFLDNTSGSPVTIGNANPINLDGNITFTGSNDLNLGTGAANINNNRTVTITAGTLTVGGGITQSGGNRTLAKAGNGTLVLGGVNSYAGNTTVSAGTLALVGGSQNSAITVNSGAALGFALGSPTTSSKAVALNGTVSITGTVDNASDYQLMTATGFTGTPTLSAPITDYELQLREGDTELWLAYTGTGSSSPYDDWAAGFAPDDVSDPTLDFDSDGLSNQLEFAFGTDPTVSDAGALTWDGTNFTPGAPVVNVDYPIGGGVDFTARFIRRTDHGDSGSAAYAWEFSSDLGDWETSSADPAPGWFAAPTVLATQGDYQLVELPYPFFLDNGKKARFFRVEVSIVP